MSTARIVQDRLTNGSRMVNIYTYEKGKKIMRTVNTMSQKQVEEIIARHELWVSTNKERGERADFSKQTLIGMDFSNRNLSSAIFRESNLSNSNFENADLSEAIFSNTKMSAVNLTNAKMVGTNLHKANLYSATLTKTDFSYSNMYGVNLAFTSLEDCILYQSHIEFPLFFCTKVKEEILSQAEVQNTCLYGACVDNKVVETVEYYSSEK